MATQSQYLQAMGIDIWVSRGTAVKNLEPVQVDDVEPFYFLLFNYQALGICCSLAPQISELPMEVRRFCDDVAFAICRQKTSPSILELRPSPDTVPQIMISQGQQALPNTVVVFGKAFANHVLDVEDVVSGSTYQQENQKMLVVDDVQSYFGDVPKKQALWLNIKEAGLISGNGRT